MSFSRHSLKKVKRQNSTRLADFDMGSIQKQLVDFIHISSALQDESIALKKKYASSYFNDENYETPFYYKCLEVSQDYRNDVLGFKALAYFRATVSEFIMAFEVILENDTGGAINYHIKRMENFQLQLQNLMNLLPGSHIRVALRFNKEEMEQTTKAYINGLAKSQLLTICPGLIKQTCETRLTGFAVIKQFGMFLFLFNRYLQSLLKILPG